MKILYFWEKLSYLSFFWHPFGNVVLLKWLLRGLKEFSRFFYAIFAKNLSWFALGMQVGWSWKQLPENMQFYGLLKVRNSWENEVFLLKFNCWAFGFSCQQHIAVQNWNFILNKGSYRGFLRFRGKGTWNLVKYEAMHHKLSVLEV